MRTRTALTLSALLSLNLSNAHADDLKLICSGTYFLYQGGGSPEKATNEGVIITINEADLTIKIDGTIEANASGPLNVEEQHYFGVLEHSNVANGVRYPYIGVNVNRMTGEALIFSSSKPTFEGSGVMYFTGTCARSKRLF